MKTYQDIKSAATIDAVINYVEAAAWYSFQALEKKSV
jgi:hypothetical protein